MEKTRKYSFITIFSFFCFVILFLSSTQGFSQDIIAVEKSDDKWTDILNALYFYFIYKKKNVLKHIHIINFQINIWEKMDQSKKKLIIKLAKKHINYMLV